MPIAANSQVKARMGDKTQREYPIEHTAARLETDKQGDSEHNAGCQQIAYQTGNDMSGNDANAADRHGPEPVDNAVRHILRDIDGY